MTIHVVKKIEKQAVPSNKRPNWDYQITGNM